MFSFRNTLRRLIGGGELFAIAGLPHFRLNRASRSVFGILVAALYVSFCSLAHAGACTMSDTRICVIDTKLREFTGGHAVLYEEVGAGQIKSAAETEWMPGKLDVIRVAGSAEISLDDLTFLIAHEYAHSYLRHSRIEIERVALASDRTLSDLELFKKYGDEQDSPTEFCHQQEFEADAFAVRFMHFDHKSPLGAIRRVIRDGFGSDTHPSKRSRLENAKKVLDEVLAKNTADPR